jgi:hypothetical protein
VDLDAFFKPVNKQLGGGRLSVSFHPYGELKHTWRRRGGHLTMRVSDYLDHAPGEVMEAFAWYILCRAYERECPEAMAERYLAYARSRELWVPKKDTYMSRARNLSFRARGEARDLRPVFDYVNACYFEGGIRSPDLAWAKESPATRLGFYFEPLSLLAVNKVLDSEKVPRFVLEFVVYHELLHGVMEAKGSPARRIHHTREFRERERAFSMYKDAEGWLTKLARSKKGRSGTWIVPQA